MRIIIPMSPEPKCNRLVVLLSDKELAVLKASVPQTAQLSVFVRELIFKSLSPVEKQVVEERVDEFLPLREQMHVPL